MFSWGENTRYGFGLVKPNGLDKTDTDSVHFTRLTSQLRGLCAGNSVVTFIRNDGKVSVARMQEDQGIKRTGRLKSVDCKQRIQTASCGDSYVVLLSEEGRVHSLNKSNVPRPIDNLQKGRVTQVACGNQHSIALTQDGHVFTWGQNSSGQLGLRKGMPSTLTPQLLKSLSGIPLAQITAGGDHSFALSLSGAVFSWGKNSAGQLGLGDITDRHDPAPVDCLNLKKTVVISCGEGHTAVLTKGGVVFTFGSGCYGQLGHNSLRDELRPRLVAELWGSKVTQIACGRHHTLALVNSKKIYSFGRGEQGQLGNGVKIDQAVPLPVQQLQDHIEDQNIEKILAGGHHSFALCSLAQESEKGFNNPCSSLSKVTQSLDDETIDKWISNGSQMEYDSKSWREIKREITEIFSSASCLNGSFLDKSQDKHYQTSLKRSGLDLSLARLAFQKLARNDMILTEVEAVVQRMLLPSLGEEPIGVEGLRVYLVIPELLRVLVKHNRGTDLAKAFTAAIFRLHPDKLQVLEGLWSRLPYFFFRAVVKVLHSVSVQYLHKTIVKYDDHKQSLEITLGALQKLYVVNSKRPGGIAVNTFHLKKEVNSLFQTIQHLNAEIIMLGFCYEYNPTVCRAEDYRMFAAKGLCQIQRLDLGYHWILMWYECNDKVQIAEQMLIAKDLCQATLSLLMEYPCTLDTEDKCALWRAELCRFKSVYLREIGVFLHNTLEVGRTAVLSDTFHWLRVNICSPMMPLKVKFKLEDGMDDGGVSLEFFTLLAKELTSETKILDVNEDSGLAWFTCRSTNDYNMTDDFYWLGVLCGMALYNQCLLDVCFPLALFKKLLGLNPTLDDLKELSPIEARGLQELLKEEEEVVEELYLDFTVKGQTLIPNGGEVPVTKVNRQKYVDLYVDFVFNKAVRSQFEDFRTGFLQGCPLQAWRMYLPEELMTLLHGDDSYRWEELRENSEYQGYSDTDEVIQNFWSVFTEFSEEHKRRFLKFLSGTDRVPRGRHSKLRLIIVRLSQPDTDEYYPEAQTCFEELHLPNYSTIDILHERLLHAITHCDVIGKF